MTSNRPYLIRAIYEWISDNAMTPYLLVDATADGVVVPPQAVKEGRVVLNVAQRAVARLELGNDWIRFQARFSGQAFPVEVPISAVAAIYAQESGQGMMLPADEDDSTVAPDTDGDGDDDGNGGKRPPHLRVVK
ncbi:MAG: ClpXP protease specificity-enhancing factor [Xanthomonadales bacterium]|nr:ClpXP protease specificity-enhancing factor [Xanthomonadales bacterium]